MSEIIGVRFKEGGKIYYFRPNDEELELGCHVIVETVRGTECGEVVMDRREIDDSEFNREVKTIIRKATDADLARVNENKIKAKKAFDICNQKIKAHGLEMNLLDVECTFDNSKIVFYFSAEGRVDFRDLVKDLASVFRARIELRQIGVRDEAKMLGGLGVCGRPFCCHQFMGDFQSVSIKMAKEQGLSLNPVKISGTCGRLMCCLKHEQDAYEDLMRTLPQIGSAIVTPDGPGVVVDRELVAGRVKVLLDGINEAPPKTYRVADVHKPGEAPPQPKNTEEKPEKDRNHENGRKPSGKPEGRKPDRKSEPGQMPEKKSEPGQKPERKSEPGQKPDKKSEPGQKPEKKQNNSQKPESVPKKPENTPKKEEKPVFDYSGIDFEESLSGNAAAYEEYEDDNRGPRRQSNSRRPGGRRPDRRNQGRKGGKPQEQLSEGLPEGEKNPKGGNPKPRHKGKPYYNSKKPPKNREPQ